MTLAKRRDKSLESVGIRVMRIKASDILENMDAVLQRITAVMRDPDRGQAAGPARTSRIIHSQPATHRRD